MNQALPSWENIPVFNKEAPKKSFVITSDANSGGIPATRIEHWKNFTDLFTILPLFYFSLSYN